MANSPTFQSAQTAYDAGGSPTVTKPVSLAVGDLMVGHVRFNGEGGGNTFTVPAGWTEKFRTGNGGNMTSVIFYKIATSDDVAASNFTFTNSGGSEMHAALSRITDVYPTTPIDQVHGTAGTSNPTDTGITPTIAGNLILVFLTVDDDDGAAGTVSGYAVANNNPASWGEGYDRQDDDNGIAMGYGTRVAPTATGNVTATLADNTPTSSIIQVISIPTTPLSSIALSVVVPTILLPLVPEPIVTSVVINNPTLPVLSEWVNTAKSSSSWVNQTKS